MRVELIINCNSCHKEIIADKEPVDCVCYSGTFFHMGCFRTKNKDIENLRSRVNKAIVVK